MKRQSLHAGPFLPSFKIPGSCPLKDRYLVPRRLGEVVVDGEEDHESEEEAARREEVPDVVVVVEVEQSAIRVRNHKPTAYAARENSRRLRAFCANRHRQDSRNVGHTN